MMATEGTINVTARTTDWHSLACRQDLGGGAGSPPSHHAPDIRRGVVYKPVASVPLQSRRAWMPEFKLVSDGGTPESAPRTPGKPVADTHTAHLLRWQAVDTESPDNLVV